MDQYQFTALELGTPSIQSSYTYDLFDPYDIPMRWAGVERVTKYLGKRSVDKGVWVNMSSQKKLG